VANELQIHDVQKLCISSIGPMITRLTPIRKFRLAHQLVVGDWLTDDYVSSPLKETR
jgi:hypothetical protein